MTVYAQELEACRVSNGAFRIVSTVWSTSTLPAWTTQRTISPTGEKLERKLELERGVETELLYIL